MGKPKALDDAKRREICALLTAGYSMQAAAEYVDCSPRTIERELKRNPEFAEKVRHAGVGGQMDPLSTVRQKARTDWRAAAWYLERTNPDRFAKRNPALLKPDDFFQQLNHVLELVVSEIDDDATLEKIMQKVAKAAGFIHHAVDTHRRFDGSATPVSFDQGKKGKNAYVPSYEDIERLMNNESFGEEE